MRAALAVALALLLAARTDGRPQQAQSQLQQGQQQGVGQSVAAARMETGKSRACHCAACATKLRVRACMSSQPQAPCQHHTPTTGCSQRPVNIAGKVLVLSVRTLGHPLNPGDDPLVDSAAACCAACRRTDGCNAWNWCGAGGGCGAPGGCLEYVKRHPRSENAAGPDGITNYPIEVCACRAGLQ